MVEFGGVVEAGTVGGTYFLNIKVVECCYRSLELPVIGKAKVGTAKDCIYIFSRKLFVYMGEDVYQTSMGAAKDND